MKASYSLIEKDSAIVEDENFVKPSLIDKQATYPICRFLRNSKDEADYLINEIRNKLLLKYSPKDIVVIAKKRISSAT